MRRNTQISQNAIDLRYSIHFQIPFHVPEVGLTKYKRTVADLLSFLFCVFVLIERNQSSFFQKLKYLFTMTTAAEGDVYISPIRVDVQAFDALLQHHGFVIHTHLSSASSRKVLSTIRG